MNIPELLRQIPSEYWERTKAIQDEATAYRDKDQKSLSVLRRSAILYAVGRAEGEADAIDRIRYLESQIAELKSTPDVKQEEAHE